ncbi:hypothetical protein L3556_10965 [Candidatus Synechococcus calcipolaris G9]|uniref:DUF4352 domain-containing protein n=1 Tax=Candidatus Synechococcus calcipolaris G9 TaxID=1497997 RepID=A0ABT6F0U7_9SYNE|nr:hypothetical protein [Candidatus Synechococcus calcipolaris]MDG2991445.1 hypothetical protein [Candidatus Synechococcus calcipolaris G9]
MKLTINPGVRTSLTLITIMLAIGGVTGLVGFIFGREALRGVSQPIVNPILSTSMGEGNRGRQSFLKEEDIIAQAKKLTGGDEINSPPKQEAPSPSPKPEAKNENEPEEALTLGEFPIVGEDQGIRFEVSSARTQGDELVLQVSLKNDSSQGVQFLYTFLEVTNDKGESLSALTNGLPTELPAGSDVATGTINISQALLRNAKAINLKLSNYPNQDVELHVPAIPVE